MIYDVITVQFHSLKISLTTAAASELVRAPILYIQHPPHDAPHTGRSVHLQCTCTVRTHVRMTGNQ